VINLTTNITHEIWTFNFFKGFFQKPRNLDFSDQFSSPATNVHSCYRFMVRYKKTTTAAVAKTTTTTTTTTAINE